MTNTAATQLRNELLNDVRESQQETSFLSIPFKGTGVMLLNFGGGFWLATDDVFRILGLTDAEALHILPPDATLDVGFINEDGIEDQVKVVGHSSLRILAANSPKSDAAEFLTWAGNVAFPEIICFHMGWPLLPSDCTDGLLEKYWDATEKRAALLKELAQVEEFLSTESEEEEERLRNTPSSIPLLRLLGHDARGDADYLEISAKSDAKAAARGPAVVYFIEAVGTGTVKIGYSSWSPQGRMRSMTTGCPHELRIMTFFPGSRQDESDLHQRFKKQRIRGEWFRLDTEIRSFVAGLERARKSVAEGGNPS